MSDRARLSRTATALLALASASLVTITPAATQTFEGQTIRLVIASTASGPTDTLARQFAPFIARHIPGKPAIVPENRPGGVGVIAANYMFSVAKPDGLTIGLMFGMVTQGLMRGEGVRYDPAQFQLLGAISQTQVLLARKDLALQSPRDLLKPAKPLVLARASSTPSPSGEN
jgi:tripartite-type tricarboxylate transporter receptor subunit TctC